MNRAAESPSIALFLTAILLLGAALRVHHLGGSIAERGGWRQAETAQVARSFFEREIDPMRPSVCWLGPHRTLAQEFPLPEAVTALVYRAIGRESLIVPRLLSLLCFLGAAGYLALLVARLFGVEAGLYAAVIYVVLPLGLYASRAVQVDPAALLCAHAALYYAALFYEEGDWTRLLAASAWAAAGAVMRAPYLLCIVLPAVALVATRLQWQRATALVVAAIPPVVAFVLWRRHVAAIAAQVPNWSFIPGFRNDVARHLEGGAQWLLGAGDPRLDPVTWGSLAHRLWLEVAGPIGAVLVGVGLLLTPAAARRFGGRSVGIAWAWVLASVLYVLAFFDLTVSRDEYSLPLLATVAVMAAVGLETFRREWAEVVPWVSSLAVVAALVALGVNSQALARRFEQRDEPRAEAAALIAHHTPRRALVVAAAPSASTDDPRLLYGAGRYGWSVAMQDVNDRLIERLEGAGATHVAVMLDRETPPALTAFESGRDHTTYELDARPWRLLLFDLRHAR